MSGQDGRRETQLSVIHAVMQPKMSKLHIHTAILSLLTAGKSKKICKYQCRTKMMKLLSNICSILSPISGCVRADSTCRSRRCLAEMLINKNYLSQPQYENCTQKIHVPFMEYQTLSVVSWSKRRKTLILFPVKLSGPSSLCRFFQKSV